MPGSDPQTRTPLALIANDQEWSARSLESIIGPHGYAVLRAYTGRQALELARNAQPDVVILEARLPDVDGIDVCEALRNDPNFSATTPIVITTSGPAGRAQRLAAFMAGAWEFCSQPIDGEVLLLKLDTFMTAKREADNVRDESLLDQITGLYNMRGLARRAREIGADAYRRSDPLACVALTAEPGPLLSDPVLMDELAARIAQHLGAILRRTGRTSDAIGRLGPSEFAIIAPGTEAKGAARLAERLQHLIEAEPLSVGDAEHHMTIRAGYCAVPNFTESSVDAVELLLRAASALRDPNVSEQGLRIRGFNDIPSGQIH
jgi:diguanylate cyclase (GGDEF)-like protein